MTAKTNIGAKYEILADNKREWPVEGSRWFVYQIRALRDFGDVKSGDLGGYISDYDCLDRWNGNCWIGNDAVVSEASVKEEAVIKDNAVVKDNAIIRGNAVIKNNAIIAGNVMVNQGTIGGDTMIGDNFWIRADYFSQFEKSA